MPLHGGPGREAQHQRGHSRDGADTRHGGLTACLSTLTEMINDRSRGQRPGWWLPAGRHPAAATVPASGAATTGPAHGIAGPLAQLATARTAGFDGPGQDTAIRRAARWLLHWQETDHCHTWPPFVTGDELDHDTPAGNPGRRHAWCYGTPGIARALTLAADAITDDTIRAAADQAVAAIADLPPTAWDVEGPSLCHGNAGALLATPHPRIASHAAAAITAAFDPRHRDGFHHQHHGITTDEPGLLTRAAGITLALADHGRLPQAVLPTAWSSVLLLS